ncbi:hypothetical protein Dimus_023124 [Dionaea muscipula]
MIGDGGSSAYLELYFLKYGDAWASVMCMEGLPFLSSATCMERLLFLSSAVRHTWLLPCSAVVHALHEAKLGEGEARPSWLSLEEMGRGEELGLHAELGVLMLRRGELGDIFIVVQLLSPLCSHARSRTSLASMGVGFMSSALAKRWKPGNVLTLRMLLLLVKLREEEEFSCAHRGDRLGSGSVMSSPSREWSWEPRVPIHPSLLEMTPLRIPSPAPDSLEYSCQGSEESSFSVGVPPSYPLVARLEGRSPKKLRIKLKSSCPELELSSSSFVSIGGGGSDRFHDPDDDDVRSYVSSEEPGLRTPPLQDLTGIPSRDETDMTKGRRLQLPSGAFARGGRGRRGAGGRGRPDSPDRARVSTRDPEARDQRSSRDVEDRPPKPPSAELTRGNGVASDNRRESQKRRPPTGPIDFQDPFSGRELAVPLGGSACGSSSSVTPTSYAKERFKYEMIDGHRVELDSNGNILPRDLRFAGPQPKICGLPYPDDGFIYCESNALALAQAMANSLNIVGQLISVSQEAIVDRDAAWSKVKTLEEEIASLHELHKELTHKYNESHDSVRRLEGSLKKERNQSTSRLTELESAQSKCGELERKIERLEKKIAELEQQRPSSMDEMIDLWQANEEGMAAITELARPFTKAGYNMAFQHFGSYLSEVPAEKKWDGLPWPQDDIGVTNQNLPYYIADGPPPPIVIDAEEEAEPGEVNNADS